jgi:hypothetical protein
VDQVDTGHHAGVSKPVSFGGSLCTNIYLWSRFRSAGIITWPPTMRGL